MPYVPTPTLEDAITQKRDREKLEKLLVKRAAFSYTFDIHKLLENLDPEVLQECIIATNEEDAKTAKAEVNDSIAAIFSTYDVKSLECLDAFGSRKQAILFSSSNTRLDKGLLIKAKEKCPHCNKTHTIDPRAIEASTVRTPYTTVSVRDVKEREESE